MDITIMAKCHRCTKEFMMGTDTHYYKYMSDMPMIAGRCPWCGATVSHIMRPDNIRLYPPQDGVDITDIPYHAGH